MIDLRSAAALLRFYLRVVPHRWYLQAPFLPLPPRKYVAWRLQTAYGSTTPPWRVIWQDLWQFGSWLADLDETV